MHRILRSAARAIVVESAAEFAAWQPRKYADAPMPPNPSARMFGAMLWVAFLYVLLTGPQFGIGKRGVIWAHIVTYTELFGPAVAVELVVKKRGMMLNRITFLSGPPPEFGLAPLEDQQLGGLASCGNALCGDITGDVLVWIAEAPPTNATFRTQATQAMKDLSNSVFFEHMERKFFASRSHSNCKEYASWRRS